jgi:hypothetical protein
MLAKQREKVLCDNVLAKIRRNISNPQSTIGAAVILVRLNILAQWHGMAAIPIREFARNRMIIKSGVIVQRKDEIGVGLRRARIENDRLAIGLDGPIHLASLTQEGAEIITGCG